MSGIKHTNIGNRRRNLSRFSVMLSAFAAMVLVAMLVVLCRIDNVKVSQSRNDIGFEQIKDYTCKEKKDAEAPIGVRKEYTFSLGNQIKNDSCLAFYTVHQYVDVWLNGEQIYCLKIAEDQWLSKTPGCNWVMIPIYREDAGKEVRIEITPVYESFRDREVEFLTGSQLAIYRNRLAKDLPQIILGIMAAFVGVIFICVAGYNVVKKHRGKNMMALGLFSVMMGLWKLTDTRFSPFLLSDKPIFLFYVSITMLMLGMIPLMKWVKGYFTKISRQVLDSYCMVVALICLVQLSLQFLGVLDLRDTLWVTHIVIAAGVVMAIGCLVCERIKYPNNVLKMPVGKMFLFICTAGVMADVAAFYIKGNSSGLVFTLLSFLLCIVFMGIETIFRYSEQELQLAEQEHQLAEKDRLLAEQERKLTQRRIATMMSQIRSHFIFNVLTTISSYCKTDPKKADKALIHFSRYLRKNIRIIEEEGLIDFSMELEQLEDYVALEQMRFLDKITFVEDIETTSFQIPPLTIQPIVENAIKHGLVEHGKSGTICLCTMREENHVIITIVDDGVGFVPEESGREDSVGIRNVRYRLETMVGGSLNIESVPGEGTKVTISIPVMR